MQSARLGLLCAGACLQLFLAVSAMADEDGYYVDSRGVLAYVPQGDPAEVKVNVREWRVLLYKGDAPRGGRDNWGVISGKTAGSVMNQLRASRAFEKQYERWCKCGPDVYTFHNSLGPIAVFDAPRPVSQKIADAFLSLKSRVDALRKLQQKLELLFFDKPSATNPFAAVGKVLVDYGTALRDAERKLTEVGRALTDGSPEGRLEQLLASAAEDLGKAEQEGRRLDAATPGDVLWTRPVGTYTTQNPLRIGGKQYPELRYTVKSDIGVQDNKLLVKISHVVRESGQETTSVLQADVHIGDPGLAFQAVEVPVTWGRSDKGQLWAVAITNPNGSIQYSGNAPEKMFFMQSASQFYQKNGFRILYDDKALAQIATEQLQARALDAAKSQSLSRAAGTDRPASRECPDFCV